MKIQVMGASVPGTQHTMPGRPAWVNNQDSYSWQCLPDGTLVAVVCDGCGSGQFSEVGAHLAARGLVRIIEEKLKDRSVNDLPWSGIRNRLVDFFDYVARFTSVSIDVRKDIECYFLFTIIGMVITEETICVFNFGDGMYAVDGVFTTLGPFPNNAPPYLMYAVTGSPVFDRHPDLREFQIRLFPRAGIKTVLVGSDGVEDMFTAHNQTGLCYPGKDVPIGPIDRLFTKDFFNNPDQLRRHLSLMNIETVDSGRIKSGLLPDDTTIIMAYIENH